MLAKLLIRFAPYILVAAVALAGTSFVGFKGWWNAHQNQKELKHEVDELKNSIKAREEANDERAERIAGIDNRGHASLDAISQVPAGDCFDAPLPDDIVRLLSPP